MRREVKRETGSGSGGASMLISPASTSRTRTSKRSPFGASHTRNSPQTLNAVTRPSRPSPGHGCNSDPKLIRLPIGVSLRPLPPMPWDKCTPPGFKAQPGCGWIPHSHPPTLARARTRTRVRSDGKRPAQPRAEEPPSDPTGSALRSPGLRLCNRKVHQTRLRQRVAVASNQAKRLRLGA